MTKKWCVGRQSGSAVMTEGNLEDIGRVVDLSFEKVDLFTCDICGQENMTETDMHTHVLVEHVEGSISCPFCDLGGITVEEMNTHVNAEHLSFTGSDVRLINASVQSRNIHNNNTSICLSNKDVNNAIISSPSYSENSSIDGSDTTASTMPISNIVISIAQPSDSPSHQSSSNSSSSLGRTNGYETCDSPVTEQSQKRNKLHLEVPFKTFKKDKNKVDHIENLSQIDYIDADNNDDTPTFDCPLCAWFSNSTSEITKHVNEKHINIISPNRKTNSNTLLDNVKRNSINSKSSFECPICGLELPNGSLLEIHVNTIHDDIFSPSTNRKGRVSPMSLGNFSSNSGQSCPICGMEFSDINELTTHVDGHFSGEHTPVSDHSADGSSDTLLALEIARRDKVAQKLQEEKEFEKLQDLYGMSGKVTYKSQAEQTLERAVVTGELSVSDYHTYKMEMHQSNVAGIEAGHSRSSGILEVLKSYYKTSSGYNIYKNWLCSPCDHYAASYGDKGWGCGYRNFQMLLSCLSKNITYEEVLFNGRPLIPSITKIQQLIEAAWQKGFDIQGCEQLGGRITNTNKWIGATEIVATLSSLKIKCKLIDFHAPTSIDGTHPKLFEWVRDYFSKDISFKPPLYLQHQGHSRTIIGIEELKDGSLRLLLFDPSSSKNHMKQFHHQITANLMRSIRRSPTNMKAKQYQIVSVVGILTPTEYEDHKEIRSDRIPNC